MKKLLFLVVAMIATVFSVNAQVKIESPHEDFDVQIARCSAASGTVIVDMIITNFGPDVNFSVRGRGVSAYDDEGNAYTFNNTKILLGLVSEGMKEFSEILFPQDVPLKFRIQIKGISNNASKFTLFKFCPDYASYNNDAMGLNSNNFVVIRNLEWIK